MERSIMVNTYENQVNEAVYVITRFLLTGEFDSQELGDVAQAACDFATGHYSRIVVSVRGGSVVREFNLWGDT
jgi:hypothetical protein